VLTKVFRYKFFFFFLLFSLKKKSVPLKTYICADHPSASYSPNITLHAT
jgi:hypothetical protein